MNTIYSQFEEELALRDMLVHVHEEKNSVSNLHPLIALSAQVVTEELCWCLLNIVGLDVSENLLIDCFETLGFVLPRVVGSENPKSMVWQPPEGPQAPHS